MPELSGDEEEVYRNFGVIRGFGLNGGGGATCQNFGVHNRGHVEIVH